MLRQPLLSRRLPRLSPSTSFTASTTSSLSTSAPICPSCSHSLLLRRTLLRPPRQPSRREQLERLDLDRLAAENESYYKRRQAFLRAGAITSFVTFVLLGLKLVNQITADASLPAGHPLSDPTRKVVKHDENGREIVPTGNSTVPEFPRTLELPNFAPQSAPPPPSTPSVTSPTLLVQPSATSDTEYTLVGLGTRSVSFLGINVYVVGYYIATADIAELQARLVRKINPIASTLVANEKDDLRKKLLDSAEGEALWDELLASGVPARSVVRVVPVRDTDFHHLRDGFVRAIQARAAKVQDEQFGEAMREFKTIFNRGKVPKKKELLMLREQDGRLTMVYDDGAGEGRKVLGMVEDERISRALWMNYLAGKKVASEEAKVNITNGVLEFVERPVGTVASQVV